MIFAAGLGTRLYPETKEIPKALVKIDDRTLLELAITQLKKQGINQFIINIHHFGGKILNFLEKQNDFGVDITISDERNQLLNTGGGLVNMEQYIDKENFIIFNVDILSNINLTEMVNFHKKNHALATIAVRNRKTSRYFLFNENNQLKGWQNIKTGEVKCSAINQENLQPLAFNCIHVINPDIFQYKPLDNTFSIVDWYLELSKTYPIYGYQNEDYYWHDVGKHESLAEVRNLIGELRI